MNTPYMAATANSSQNWLRELNDFSKKNPVATFGFLLLTWIICNPWLGFWHDGFLYLGQALHHLYPQNYVTDPFFMFGSQDDYTFFTPVFSALIKWFGLSAASQALMLLSHILWFIAIFLLFQSMLGDIRFAAIACLVILALPPYYGGANSFWYSEPFLTARSFAEPAVLAGLYFTLRQRVLIALGVLLFACLIHPLVGISGLIVWYSFLVIHPPIKHGRFAAVLLVVFAISGAVICALNNVAPFSGLLEIYNPSWFSMVHLFNNDLFLANWHQHDWLPKAAGLSLIILYFRNTGEPANRHFLLAILSATFIGLGCSFLLGDYLKIVLAMSLQLWRTLWLFQVIIPGFVLAWIAARSHALPLSVKWSATLSVLTILMQSSIISLIVLALAVVLIFMRNIAVRPQLARLMNIGLIAAIVLAVANRALLDSVFLSAQFTHSRFQLLYLHPIALLIGCTLFAICIIRPRWQFTTTVLMIFTVFTATTWDRRSEEDRVFEDGINKNPISSMIAPGDAVIWNSFKPMPWLALNRATYINGMLGAAVLFNNDFAYEYSARYTRWEHYSIARGCKFGLWARGFCADSASTINPELCQIDDRINWIVSGYKSSLPSAAHWAIKTPAYPDGLYLYSCKTWLSLPSGLGTSSIEGKS